MADSKKPFMITNFRAVDMPNASKPVAKAANTAPKAPTAKKKTAHKGVETLSSTPEANSTGTE
jgi:hypothetical protein